MLSALFLLIFFLLSLRYEISDENIPSADANFASADAFFADADAFRCFKSSDTMMEIIKTSARNNDGRIDC